MTPPLVPPLSKHAGVCIFWIIPPQEVAMDTSLNWSEVLGPLATLKAPVPKRPMLIYWQ